MTMSDPIADMLTRIRNANTAKHDTVDVPASKMKLAIAQILLEEGYIKKYDVLDEGSFKTIHITLKYGEDKNDKIISGIKRISKPGLRVYAGKEELPRVLGRSWHRNHFHQPGCCYRQEGKRAAGRRRGSGLRLVKRPKEFLRRLEDAA